MNARQTQGIVLMVTTLGILVLPGIVINNLQNNGLINTSQAMTCTTSGGGTCVLSAPVGCSVSTTNCQLQGSSISFLNACSPFTNILTQNFAGFVNSFFTNCNQGTTQTINQNNLVESTINTTVTFSSCTRNTGGSLAYVYAWNCSTANPSLSSITLPVLFSCPSWNFVFGNLTKNISPTPSVCIFYFTASNTIQFQASCSLYGPPANGFNLGSLSYAICVSLTSFKQAPAGVGGNLNSSVLGFFVSLIGAALILLLAFGATVGIATFTAGSNPQGTKLAQTFGIALLLWGPLNSEFSPWFTSGFLPYGLDGVIGIISIALTAAFFVGAYAVSQTGTATSQ
jgi:hypothetical protein